MPYLRTPSGKYIEIPEGLSDAQAVDLARKQFPKLYGIEPTVGGQVREFVKGVPAGFVGSFGQAARGLGALLPEDYEKPFAAGVEKTVQALTPEAAAGYEDTVGRKLGEAMGSVGSFLIPGGAVGVGAKAMGAGLAGVKAAQLGTAGALGSAAGAGEARTRAEAENATAEQRRTATQGGALIGLSEIAPVERFLGGLGKEVVGGAVGMIKRALVSGGVEAAQEAASNIAQNLLAREVYKPGQQLMEGAAEGAGYGFGAGALTQVLLDTALGRRARTAPPPTPLDEEKRKQEQAAAQLQQQRQATVEAGYAPEGQGRLFEGEATPLPVTATAQQLYQGIREAEQKGDTQTASQLRNDLNRLQSELQDPEALQQRRQQLQDARDGITEQIQALAGKDPAGIKALRQQGAGITQEIKRVDALLAQTPAQPSPEQAAKKLQALTKQLEKAKADGDEDTMESLTDKVVALRATTDQTGDLLADVPLVTESATERNQRLLEARDPQARREAQISRLQTRRKQLVQQKKDTSAERARYIQQQIDALDQELETLQQATAPAAPAEPGSVFADQYLEQLDEAQQARLQQARDTFNAQRRQRVEEAGAEQAGARAEALVKDAPLESILISKGIKLQETDLRRRHLEKLERNIYFGNISTQVASLLGLPRVAVNLSEAPSNQIAQTLKNIDARLARLIGERNNKFPNKELVVDGKLTEDGLALVGVDAAIGELRKLQSAALLYQKVSDVETAIAERGDAAEKQDAEKQLERTVGAKKRAKDVARLAQQREEEMFNWGNDIDSLRKGDDAGEISRSDVEARVQKIAQLSKKEASKQVAQYGEQMPIEAQEKLEQEVQEWLGRITKNAQPGEAGGALQESLSAAGIGKQGPIERGMTITDTRAGELARLRQGVERLIARAVEPFSNAKRDKVTKKLGPFGLTQESAAVLSRRYDEQQAAAAPEKTPEIDLSGKQREMFPGSITEVTKKKQATEKRAATIASKKQAQQAETQALLQKVAAEKTKKQRKLERRERMASFRQKINAEQQAVSKRTSEERLSNLSALKEKIEKEIASVKAAEEAERVAPLAGSVLADMEYAEGLSNEQRDRLTRQVLEEANKAKINLKSFSSLGNLSNVAFSGETAQYLRGLEAQLNAVRALLEKTQADVTATKKREDAQAKLQEAQKRRVRVPAGQVATPEETRPLAKKETAEDKAARVARDDMRARVEQQFDLVAETQAAIAAEERRIEEQLRGEWLSAKAAKAIYDEDPLYNSMLDNMEYEAGLTLKQREKVEQQVREAAAKYRSGFAASLIGTERYKKRLTRDNKALQSLKKDLKVFEAHLKELTAQENALRTEAQLKPLKQQLQQHLNRLEQLVKNGKDRDAAVNKQAGAQVRSVKDVLSDIAMGRIAGQRGVRVEQVPAGPNPDLEGKLEDLYARLGKLGSSVEDQRIRAEIMEQVDQLMAGTYKNVSKPLAPAPAEISAESKRAAELEKAIDRLEAKIRDAASKGESTAVFEQRLKKAKATLASLSASDALEAEQIRQSGALKIEPRKEQAVKRVPPAKEITRVKERYLVLQKQGKEKQAAALRAKHPDLFLGPLEGLVRGIESREGKQTPAPLRTGITEENAIWKKEPDFRDATDTDTGVDGAAAKAVADRVQAALPDGVEFIYAPTLADAPADFRDAVARTGRKTAKGAVMPDGRVIVVGEAHASIADVEETVAHELIGHYGADIVLGPEGVKSMVTDMTKKGLDHVAEVATGLGLFPDVATARMAMPKDVNEKVMTVLVREMVAHAAEGRRVAPRFAEKVKTFIRDLISKVRGFFRNAGLSSLAKADTKAIQMLLNKAEKELSRGRLGIYRTPDGEVVFNTAAAKPEGMPEELWNMQQQLVGNKKKPILDRVLSNITGIGGMTQFVDRFAPVKMAAKIGVEQGKLSDLEAMQNLYHLSNHGKRMNYTRDIVEHGPRELVEQTENGEKFWMVRAKEGAQPTLVKMFSALDKSGLTSEQYEGMFTLFLASQRIKNDGVGAAKLNYGKDAAGNPIVTEAKLKAFEDYIKSQKQVADAFAEARAIYNEYNKGLVDFAVQSGAISKERGAALKKKKDYIPFYREDGGKYELVLDDETAPVAIGNLKDQPYLQDLIGGDQRILPIFMSAVQNTQLLTDIALRNLATRDTAFLLVKMGMADKIRPELGGAGPDILRFKVDGEDRHVQVQTKGTIYEDIPAELLVKGMEGVKTTFPAALELLGAPAKLLRRFVVLSPLYPIRQIIRDSFSALGTSGANFVPVYGPLKEVAKAMAGKSETAKRLQSEGFGGGQLLAGTDAEGVSTILRAVASGKTTAGTVLAKMEAMSMMADTGLRAAAYDSFRKQGLNSLRAWIATNEIIDFNRQGLSPSTYVANTLIPFFNTQIQGLSVIGRAMSGRMPMDEKLRIQEKFYKRGLGLAAMTLLYAAMMQDDEAYQNASPEARLSNWFVRIPGVDEPLKIPIPFEYGLLFKAIPEALFTAASADGDTGPTMKALGKLALNSVPGGSSYMLPQTVKPLVEVVTGVDLFTGNAIETPAMQKLDPAERYREDTTELAKTLGAFGNISPVRIDQFIKSVGSQTLLSLVSLTNPLLAGNNPPSASMKTSKLPFVGAAFQATDAGGIINRVYEQMEEAVQAKNTYTKLLEEGREEKAERYFNENLQRIMAADSAAAFRNEMNQLTSYEKVIRADRNMSPEEKRTELDEVRRLKIETAKQYRAVLRDAA